MRLRNICLGLVAALLLCGGAAVYFLRARSYEWREITSSDSQFRVNLPSDPSLSVSNEKSTDGSPFVSHILKSTPADRVFYVVSWWENPTQQGQTTEELFAHFRQCDINVFNARVMSEKDVKVQGYPAKLIFIMGGNGLIVENLAIRADTRVYSLTVLDSRAVLERENIRKFFGSFRLEQ